MKAVLFCYRLTMLTSAALLFSVQPMVGKMVLPELGGTPAVWTTCMVFFQSVLLAGYAYAHATSQWLGARRQMLPHGVLLLLPLGLGVLPIALPEDWTGPETGQPAVWLLGLLAVMVGAPLLVVSSTAPLVQRWFSETSHPTAGDPYYLYGSSNLGSMLALLGYPLVVEPNLRLSQQAWLWAAGYCVLVALSAACAILVWRMPRPAGDTKAPKSRAVLSRTKRPQIDPPSGTPVTIKDRLSWAVLAFVPSSWMLAVTAYLSTDIAAIPLLWIVPLALYLLTFILVFARRPLVPHAWIIRLFPLAMTLLAVSIIVPSVWTRIVVQLGAFFVGAMFCHGRLVRRRPPAERLTHFYLWMSIGGALGGGFNALAAPVLFPVLLEFPIIVGLACLLLPRAKDEPDRRFDLAALLVLTLLIASLLSPIDADHAPTFLRVMCLLGGVPLLIATNYFRRPAAFAAALVVILLCDQFSSPMPGVRVLHTERSFFGVHRVVIDLPRIDALGAPAPQFRRLLHGTTQHGFQHVDPELAREPMAYYHRQGPLGDVFEAIGAAASNGSGAVEQQIAVVGLGTGATACYASPGRFITFYEIDSTVRRLAENPDFFTYLSDSGRGRYRVIVGDGRRRLAAAPDGDYRLIILDAFSSDAVPIHLLTREAVALYLSKLKENGLLVFHVSNNHLDLVSPLAALAADAGLECLVCRDLMASPQEAAQMEHGRSPSTYVVMARRRELLRKLMAKPRWKTAVGPSDQRVWTDDYSNILSVIVW